jgi:two-component system phosphate regulon sensor histidine kinase PhoR
MVVFLGLFILLAALLITVYISYKITRPINATINFARHFSDGDYTRRILNYSNDEIGAVQRALNKMADTIVDKMENLLFERKKLQLTLESISDGIAVIDSEKRVLIANMAFLDYLDVENFTEMRLYYEVIRSRSLNSKIEYALVSGSVVNFEEKFNGSKILDVSIKPLLEEKDLQGILVVLHDVTEKKKIEQIKTDLVSNLSHELKTPVAIIRGYLETIEENLDDVAMSRSFIQKAIINAERQNSIINDILKLNMIESSHDYLAESVNIREVIENCVALLRPKAAGKAITLVADDLVAVDAVHQTARFLTEEIFFNIVDNAVNYTNERGSVVIRAEKKGSERKIHIQDSGIGIPDDALDRVFERFYRVDKSRSRDTGGTGLGLSIVKHAADLLGWEISVQSGGRGTVFTVTFYT